MLRFYVMDPRQEEGEKIKPQIKTVILEEI